MPEEILPGVNAHELFSGWEEATKSSERSRKPGRLSGEGVCCTCVRRTSVRWRFALATSKVNSPHVAPPPEAYRVAECSLFPTFASLPALYKNTAA